MENCVSGKNEKKYYNDMLDFSVKNLMVFPYHLSDFIVKKLDVTPFQFYVSMLDGLMAQDKSYDSLPNFTAADCKYSKFTGQHRGGIEWTYPGWSPEFTPPPLWGKITPLPL